MGAENNEAALNGLALLAYTTPLPFAWTYILFDDKVHGFKSSRGVVLSRSAAISFVINTLSFFTFKLTLHRVL